MKRKLAVPLVIVVYFLCSGKSCSSGEGEGSRMNAKITMIRDSVMEVFETDYLPDATLHAYELTAKQKLMDLTDYYMILNDTSADPLFRKRAADLIRASFITDQAIFKLNIHNWESSCRLNEFLREGLANHYPLARVKMETIRIQSPLRRINDTLYTGKLRFGLSTVLSLEDHHKIATPEQRSVEMHVARVKKVFGNDTLRVWSVLLGDMN
jgi:hypothetical protein